MMNNDTDFSCALSFYDIPHPPTVISDTQFTRWGKGSRYFAKAVDDGFIFGDWVRAINECWFPKNTIPLTREQIKARKVEARKIQNQVKATRTVRQNSIAEKALFRWKNSEPIAQKIDHPYLSRKQIHPHAICIENDHLLIPLYDINGKLWSLQTIDAAGNKRFLSGGKKQGCFHIIGDTEALQHVYVCEGYATAVSIYEATGLPTIVAFDAGNLEPVIRAFRQRFLKLNITIAADNDAYGVRNIGKEKAEDAARKYGCKLVFPVFNNTDNKPTDFNDLHVREGLDYVRKTL